MFILVAKIGCMLANDAPLPFAMVVASACPFVLSQPSSAHAIDGDGDQAALCP
jgi:hypothetical protein